MTDAAPQTPSPRPPRARTVAVLAIACACGWLVMELEILGARVLAPYFGGQLWVAMGSVLGVFLLSLAIGYVLGGWVSGRRRSRRILGALLMASGLWLCGLPFVTRPICERIFNAVPDVRWGSLAASFALFAVPTALLGTVSPTAVRWLTVRAGESGVRAGTVFAFSTVAGFGAAIVTAFYLVGLSVRWTICTSGAALALLGCALVVHSFVRSGVSWTTVDGQ